MGNQVIGPINAQGQVHPKPPTPPPPKAAPSLTPTAALPEAGVPNPHLGQPARVPLGGVGRGVELLAKQADGHSLVLVQPGEPISWCALLLMQSVQSLMFGWWLISIVFD